MNRRKFILASASTGLAVILSSFKKFKFSAAPKLDYNIILGRPTNNKITISLLTSAAAEIYFEYGSNQNNLSQQTKTINIVSNSPAEIVLENLPASKRCYYRLCWKQNTEKDFIKEKTRSFHTKRHKKEAFVFTITADSHLGTLKHCDPALYQTTLDNLAKDNSDLHFSLGDDFRASKVNEPNYNKIEQLYINQRQHLGTVCDSVPYFFILGNHELEAKSYYDGTENCIASWSTMARKKYIPNPYPDSFYSGSDSSAEGASRQNYFAFEWGDALFVTLDVFWYSAFSPEDNEFKKQQHSEEFRGMSKEERMQARQNNKIKGEKNKDAPRKNQWDFSIGKEQYQWLCETLEKNKSKYKFVFGHHVMGSCRGAVEWADKFEWGGHNRHGENEFSKNRPGWKMPIHDLFVKNNVTAFFQGHDHLFVRQEKDGVAYITCPMCGDPGYNSYNIESYFSGDKLSNTGHLKIMISEKEAVMHYIKAVLPDDEAAQGPNGKTAYAWSFTDKKQLKTS